MSWKFGYFFPSCLRNCGCAVLLPERPQLSTADSETILTAVLVGNHHVLPWPLAEAQPEALPRSHDPGQNDTRGGSRKLAQNLNEGV
jgi:hypothetical protein